VSDTDFPKLTLDEILNGRKLAQQTVPICLRADVLGEIQELEQKLNTMASDESDPRMVSAEAGDPVQMAQRIRELEAEAAQYTVPLRLQALPRKAWNALVDLVKDVDEETGKSDLNVGKLAETAFAGFDHDGQRHSVLVSPEMDEAQKARFLAGLSEAQWEQIVKATWDLNRTVTTVGKSVTASRVLTRTDAKPNRDGQ
jgi:hypothetical protein